MQITPQAPIRVINDPSESDAVPHVPGATVDWPYYDGSVPRGGFAQIGFAEGIGSTGAPTTMVIGSVDPRGARGAAPSELELLTWHRGRLIASAEPAVARSGEERVAAQALGDALAGSSLLREALHSEHRQVVLKDAVLLSWTYDNGLQLAARVHLDPQTGVAKDPAHQGVLDALRAWQATSGVTSAATSFMRSTPRVG